MERCNVFYLTSVISEKPCMKKLLKTTLLIAVVALFFSCKKSNEQGDVEIYVLKSYQMVAGKCQIDGANASLNDNAIVANDDIVSYSKMDYSFTLTDTAIQKIKAFGPFVPFALTVNKQVIYYGIYKPAISSSSCDHSITMDVDWSSRNKIILKLGYPSLQPGVAIDDQRNNPTILNALSAQGKLN
jgi:hypothetical protein